MYTIERVDEIKFERSFLDRTKVSFSVTEPKDINLTSGSSFVSSKGGISILKFQRNWRSVFDNDTRIILLGKIKELKCDGTDIYHEGAFDFDDLCNGKLTEY